MAGAYMNHCTSCCEISRCRYKELGAMCGIRCSARHQHRTVKQQSGCVSRASNGHVAELCKSDTNNRQQGGRAETGFVRRGSNQVKGAWRAWCRVESIRGDRTGRRPLLQTPGNVVLVHETIPATESSLSSGAQGF